MKKNFEDRVKDWFSLRNGNSVVESEHGKSVDDYNRAKSVNTMPSHFGSCVLSHKKMLLNDVITQVGGF